MFDFIRFLGLGAARCGTKSLYAALTSHPLVVGALSKESRFFSQRYSRGTRWYRQRFPITQAQVDNGMVSGEFSPDYLYDPAVPERVRDTLPGTTKFLVLVRDPVQSAWSHYCMAQGKGRLLNVSFRDAIESNVEQILDRRVYAAQLERWFSVFDRDRFLVLRSETMFADGVAAIRRVQGFLGLPYSPLSLPWIGAGKRGGKPVPEGCRGYLERHFAPHNEELEKLVGITWEY